MIYNELKKLVNEIIKENEKNYNYTTVKLYSYWKNNLNELLEDFLSDKDTNKNKEYLKIYTNEVFDLVCEDISENNKVEDVEELIQDVYITLTENEEDYITYDEIRTLETL